MDDYCIGTDSTVISDNDRTKYFGAAAHLDTIPHSGVTLAGNEGTPAESNTVVEHDIVSYLSCLTNDNAHAMVNEETTSNSGAGMNLDTGEGTDDLGAQSGERPERLNLPHGVEHTVRPDSMKAGIHQGVFKIPAGGGVMRTRILQIFADERENIHVKLPL